MPKDIVSHGIFANYEEAVDEIKSRVSSDEQLALLEQLEDCPLGRFLIQNRGLDAYWTKTITENKGGYANDFETKLITIVPAFVATQERAKFFKAEVANLPQGSHIMSVPSGLLPEFSKELILKILRLMLMILIVDVLNKQRLPL